MWPIGPELDTSGICPGLQVLHGNNRIVDAFIPGRRIISLKWSPALEELRIYSPVYIPPQEFHHLRYFSYGGYAGRPLLRTLLPHLPRLEVLELIGLQCVEELVMLSEIPMLRVFILSNRSRTGWRALLSLREREAYFPQVFTACDILQHIDINIEALKYQRWFRDGSPNRPVFEVNEVLLPSWNIS
ncbi:hypothetical protein M413DRAFT_271990 [Hebeloma cylindrosporum]|uniref:F-box domain-containing protein n=1 Tax=Hebeloma cylindrosporum TaxID=76867 RepID=A0A0C3CT70_HEBCY|nr:hypothetical protein M413DRAFT_271990 [Hebeloma cylindrosporum h7]